MMNPDDGEVCYNLAAVLEASGQLDDALVAYERSVKLGIERAAVNVRNVSTFSLEATPCACKGPDLRLRPCSDLGQDCRQAERRGGKGGPVGRVRRLAGRPAELLEHGGLSKQPHGATPLHLLLVDTTLASLSHKSATHTL